MPVTTAESLKHLARYIPADLHARLKKAVAWELKFDALIQKGEGIVKSALLTLTAMEELQKYVLHMRLYSEDTTSYLLYTWLYPALLSSFVLREMILDAPIVQRSQNRKDPLQIDTAHLDLLDL